MKFEGVFVCVLLDRRLRSESLNLAAVALDLLIKDEETSSQLVLLIGSLRPSQFVLSPQLVAWPSDAIPDITHSISTLASERRSITSYSTEKNIIHHMQRGRSFGRRA